MRAGNVVTVKVDQPDRSIPQTHSRLLMKTDEHKCRFVQYLKCLTARLIGTIHQKRQPLQKENGDVVKVTLGSDVLTVNNKSSQMDTTAIIKDDRTFIPVRFVARGTGLRKLNGWND